MSLISLITALLELVGLFIKSPEQKRNEFIVDLNNALKKAKDEKDPTDLSKIINRL